jgi:hypothetical protein
MACLSCGSKNEAEFAAEIIIHLGGLANIDNPGVWVFPKLLTCLDCGLVRFNVSKPELASLVATPPKGRLTTAA